MLVGHYAAAFVAAALDRRSPALGTMFVAAQLVEIAFFVLVPLGVEHACLMPGLTALSPVDPWHAPFTHSLLGTAGFAAAWAVGVRLRGGIWRAAHLGAAVVIAGWFLDLLVHAPDLTLLGSGPRLGLALGNRPLVAMPLELALVAVAATFYASRTRNLSGGWGAGAALGILVAALIAVQLTAWLASTPAAVVDPIPLRFPLAMIAVYAALACLAAWTAQTRAPV